MTNAPAGIESIHAGHVLVVDDEEANRVLLHDILELRGHRVSMATDGEEGLARARELKPDVILLDVMMPKLDGFQVCQRLKGDPATAVAPILLVTSLDARQDRLRGIQAGANDFITKPIDAMDLTLRVRNAVSSKRVFDRLELQFQQLRALEDMRDSLVHMVVHDLRSPLTGIQAYLELLQMELGTTAGHDALDYVSAAIATLQRMKMLVAGVLDVSRFEAGQMPVNLGSVELTALVAEAVASLGPTSPTPRMILDLPAAPVNGWCDRELTGRVIGNLVGNAFKFTPDTGEIRIGLTPGETAVRISVRDSGRGIPEQDHARIFEKFGQSSNGGGGRQHSTGLGLTFVKLAVEAQGGTVGLNSTVGRGSEFWFTLPPEREQS
jgi:signal transduction histidine kinase